MTLPVRRSLTAIALAAGLAGSLTATASARSARWQHASTVAAVPTPAASAAGTTVFAGSTSPALAPMVVELGKTRVARLNVQYSTDCFAYTSNLGAAALRRATLGRNGNVSASVTTSLVDNPRIYWSGERYPDQVVEKLTATVRRGEMRGTLRATVKFLDGSTCTTGDQRFLVTNKPGRLYGGTTSQGMPVSVELSSSGQRIKHLHVGWVASCTDGSAWVIPDFLTNFTLTGGAVSTSFAQEWAISDGGKRRFDYEIASRIGKAKASGDLRVTVTEIDAAGAALGACSTPGVTWTARS